MADRGALSVSGFVAGVRLIAGRELGAYFASPVAYAYAAVFLVVSCGAFMNTFFLDSVADLTPYFDLLPYLLVAFAPSISMGVWAQEYAQNTVELVLTLPLTTGQIVLGKYLAAVAYYAMTLAGSLPLVVMVVWLGDPDLGQVVASYLGALLLGACLLAFGMLASSLTRDQTVAFVLAALVGFVYVFSGHDRVVAVLDGLAPARQLGTWLRASVSVLPRYQAFERGVISVPDVTYFLLLSAAFLWLNRLAVQRARC
jgi:ABC-2 type transport system permease protein